MNNWELFEKYLYELIQQNNTYELAIKTFRKYLKSHGMSERVFDIKGSEIDDYIDYLIDTCAGYEQTINTYITALRQLYEYLIDKNLPLRDMYGYINTTQFKEKHKAKLVKGNKKEYMKLELINEILQKVDEFLEENLPIEIKEINRRKRVLNALIARLYIKTSLILPLKTSEIIEKQYIFLEDRVLKYNDITIKMPNSYRKQLIESINYIERVYNIPYSKEQQIFDYLYSGLGKKATTSYISSSLVMTYDELEIYEMLMKKEGSGKKNPYVYQPESFKMTAIFNMLQSGTNILYVKKLTGLDIKTILEGYDINEVTKDTEKASEHINMSISNTNYYSYL